MTRILKDLNGTRYELTTGTLSELPKRPRSRYIVLSEMSEMSYNAPVRYRTHLGGIPRPPSVDDLCLLPNQGVFFIGCRPFSPRNHGIIMKAAKAAKARKRTK